MARQFSEVHPSDVFHAAHAKARGGWSVVLLKGRKLSHGRGVDRVAMSWRPGRLSLRLWALHLSAEW